MYHYTIYFLMSYRIIEYCWTVFLIELLIQMLRCRVLTKAWETWNSAERVWDKQSFRQTQSFRSLWVLSESFPAVSSIHHYIFLSLTTLSHYLWKASESYLNLRLNLSVLQLWVVATVQMGPLSAHIRGPTSSAVPTEGFILVVIIKCLRQITLKNIEILSVCFLYLQQHCCDPLGWCSDRHLFWAVNKQKNMHSELVEAETQYPRGIYFTLSWNTKLMKCAGLQLQLRVCSNGSSLTCTGAQSSFNSSFT